MISRRIAIKNLAFAVSGVILLPGCDFQDGSGVGSKGLLSGDKKDLLRAIVESIIPGDKNIPGAGALKVHEYVEIMVADCHGREVQQIFLQGLERTEEIAAENYRWDFVDLEQQEKKRILTVIETSQNEADHQFFTLVKSLSIQGYLTSEYVVKNFSDYVMVPGPEYCCTPIG